MIVKLLTEHHMEFLSLNGGCIGSSESTLVKMSNCWKSHVTAQLLLLFLFQCYLIWNPIFANKEKNYPAMIAHMSK